jgi:hypothetical protein
VPKDATESHDTYVFALRAVACAISASAEFALWQKPTKNYFCFSFFNIPYSLRLFFAYTLDANLFLVGLCYYFITLSLKMQ